MQHALPAECVRDGKAPLLGLVGDQAKRMHSPDGITAAKAFNEHRQSGNLSMFPCNYPYNTRAVGNQTALGSHVRSSRLTVSMPQRSRFARQITPELLAAALLCKGSTLTRRGQRQAEPRRLD
jgi:hypothetical protein